MNDGIVVPFFLKEYLGTVWQRLHNLDYGQNQIMEAEEAFG